MDRGDDTAEGAWLPEPGEGVPSPDRREHRHAFRVRHNSACTAGDIERLQARVADLQRELALLEGGAAA